MTNDHVGWDLGGAHLKAARVHGGIVTAVAQAPCPLWRGGDALDRAWRRVAATLGGCAHAEHAVTMTGESADCFVSRDRGVERLVEAAAQRLRKPFKVYAGAAGLLDAAAAVRRADVVASVNWHATAACLGKLVGAGVLVDVGSTTTDVVPFTPQGAATSCFGDYERMRSGELIYTGVVRTPVMALAPVVRLGTNELPVVAELFATTADVYRVLGKLPEDVDLHPSCDGAEKTPTASARRLARMFGCDAGDERDWTAHAHALAECQMRKIETAYRKVRAGAGVDCAAPLVGAGAGRFLARDLARRCDQPYVDFTDLFDFERAADVRLAGDCASAVSLACLAGGER